jgi:putative ribosome biogenesis GTPase RsgA
MLHKREKMNAPQILAINEGINGHNLLILGQSVTGKSYLINEIKDQLKKRGKSVAITRNNWRGFFKYWWHNYPFMVWYSRWPFF